jgi:tetratricopeptide (TPR) repeat protein
VRLKPDYVDGWYALGFAHWELHQYDKAIAEFQQGIRLKPTYAELWDNLGFVYKDSHEYDKAVPALQEAVRLKPDYVTAWYNLGECYAAQGNRSKVMEVYKKLRTLDQESADEFFRDNVHH